MSDPRPPRPPRCAHLAGKTMYYQLIDGRPTEEPRDPSLALLLDGGTWWCVRTCKQLGPDCEPVGHAFCTPDRGCFEPDGATPGL